MLSREPVKPDKMALLFSYSCPFCHQEAFLYSPMEPVSIRCGGCQNTFTAAPVDRFSVQFVHTMLLNGRAAVTPE